MPSFYDLVVIALRVSPHILSSILSFNNKGLFLVNHSSDHRGCVFKTTTNVRRARSSFGHSFN
nr:MAG TPA: hypothetical protein [Caudoviricetes sp.]